MARGNVKGIGYILELEMAIACMKRGAEVSQPIGDNAHYDLLVDNGKTILRVQVKSASVDRTNPDKYTINTQRKVPTMNPGKGPSSKAIAYEEGAVDILATKAGDIWFFFDDVHLLPGNVAVFPCRDRNCNIKWNIAKDRWDLFALPEKK